MNGNRMKYASTPTFGMQKRGFLKKSAPVRQVPETPDFSKAPGAGAAVPFTQPVQTQPPFSASAYKPPFQQPAPAFFQPTQSQPFAPAAQIPFAAPSFVPPASGMQLPPMQTMRQPTIQPLPLGNTAPTIQPGAPFSTRAQGYVPTQPPTTPNVQPAHIGGMTGTAAPFASVPAMNPPVMGYAAAPQAPVYPPVQPAAPSQQPPFAQPQPADTRKERTPVNADMLWSLFLFGLLPLLFIPCLFVPRTLDFLRYAFLSLTVVGLGGMWYRQMYGSSTRLIVSMVYVALCVATIAMLVQGGNDARQVSANVSPAATPAQTEAPDSLAAVDLLAQPTPAPTSSGPSQAELRLELFMSLWQVNNPTEMVELVQPSWRSKQENASQALFTLLKNRTPEDYVIEEIDGSDTDNSRTITMRATINKNTGKAPSIYRFMIMMVKEGDEWYVNPNSLASNDEQTITEENVVNNKNAGGNVTEPPRTTVTPAPPASTILYYNEGANFYHMDPNCSSVSSDNLPFDRQFTYGELAEVSSANGLNPCLKCNAPTDPLE